MVDFFFAATAKKVHFAAIFDPAQHFLHRAVLYILVVSSSFFCCAVAAFCFPIAFLLAALSCLDIYAARPSIGESSDSTMRERELYAFEPSANPNTQHRTKANRTTPPHMVRLLKLHSNNTRKPW